MGIAGKIAKGIGIAGTAFAGLAVAVNKLESKKKIWIDCLFLLQTYNFLIPHGFFRYQNQS